MKFSVLMSLYEKEQPEFLRQALDSLWTQTRPADEIILVYDGFIPDELDKIVQGFRSKMPIQVFRLPENVGLGKALNFGINYCSYEYIFRMDTDDIAVSHRFSLQCEYLDKNPDVALLGGQIAEFETLPENPTTTRSVPISLPEIQKYAKKRNPFNHMTVAYKKSAVKNAGGYQHHWVMEDYNLWLRLLANGEKLDNLPEILVYARTGAGMLARRHGWKYVQSEWQLCRLKYQLHIQAALPALFWFVVRSLPRLLPMGVMRWIYVRLRR